MLRELYVSNGVKACIIAISKLPGERSRSVGSVKNRAHVLGIKVPLAQRAVLRGAWSKEEMAILRNSYPRLGALALVPLLPRRTLVAIQMMASKNGIAVAPDARGAICSASKAGLEVDTVRPIDPDMLRPFDAVLTAWLARPRPGSIVVPDEELVHG